MKIKTLPVIIFILGLLTAADVFSQSKKFFAVTGEQFGSTNWIAFRQLDLDARSPVKTLYVPTENNEAVYDALSGAQLIGNSSNAAATSSVQACGCLNNRMVAAIAY